MIWPNCNPWRFSLRSFYLFFLLRMEIPRRLLMGIKTKIMTWFLVGGDWNMFHFPISWGCHHPDWRTHIFQRGGSTTNHIHRLSIDYPLNIHILTIIRGRYPQPPTRFGQLLTLDIGEISCTWGLYPSSKLDQLWQLSGSSPSG